MVFQLPTLTGYRPQSVDGSAARQASSSAGGGGLPLPNVNDIFNAGANIVAGLSALTGKSGVAGASTTRTTGSGSAGGGVSAQSYDPAAIAYYDDQINQVNQALGRINAQRGIGQENINSSFNDALNTLTGQNAQAVRNAGITRQNAIDDNVQARARVDADVARQSQSLRRLLGNASSAANFAAPRAVAEAGNTQQGAIQTGFGRNLQSLDIADQDRERAFNDARSDLDRQVQQQRNQLEAGLLQNEAQLNESLSGLNLQKAQARGQNYLQARGATTGYNDRVSNILNQIDQLGRNPSIAARTVNYTAPSLEQYNTQNIGASLGQQSPGAANVGQYGYLIGDERQRRAM